MKIELGSILDRFLGQKIKLRENSYNVICPCHKDKKPSLTVTKEDNKLLFHCKAGCNTENILNAINLTFKDISDSKELNCIERLKEQNNPLTDKYDYTDENGNYIYTKFRFLDKKMLFGHINYSKDVINYGVKGIQKTLYNLPNTIKAIENNKKIFIVEGEKDVETLREKGLIATTCGGASDWKKEYSKYFTGAKVIILPDNDEAGLKLAKEIKKDIKDYAHSIKECVISSLNKGDITDYLEKENGTIDEMMKKIDEVQELTASWISYNDKGNAKINSDILGEVIAKNLDYAIIRHKGSDKEDIFIYSNGAYNISTRNELKGYIKRYLPTGLATDTTLNNTFNLIMCNTKSKKVNFEEMDNERNYINLKNGLYNIVTGKLEKHTPKMLSTIQLQCNYAEETSSTVLWNSYINRLCTNENGEVDRQKIDLLQEWMGLILSNIPVYLTKSCLILYSLLGNTGKSIFLNVVSDLLGVSNTINLPIQDYTTRFALSGVYGKRAIIVGDQSSGDIYDSSTFKQLTGGDVLDVEFKGKSKFSFLFKGGILMGCNGLPCFVDDKGGHIFERLCIVPCTNTIPKHERDGDFLKKVLKERDGIFKWALEGLNRLIKNDYKFTKSDNSEEVKTEFRKEIDTVFNYISENYTITNDKNDRVKKTDFEDNYIKWCEDNDYRYVHKKNIKERMEKIGCSLVKSCGNWYYIKLSSEVIEKVSQEEEKEIEKVFKEKEKKFTQQKL